MTIYISHNLKETQNLAKHLANFIQPGCLILLSGPLGSGKTAFTQSFGKAIGIQRAIKSPTYTIAKEYELNGPVERMVHMDAYRLEEGGADTVDFDQFLDSQTICLIEWPEFVMDYLPKEYLEIKFNLMDQDQRRIEIGLSQNLDSNSIYYKLYDQLLNIIEGVDKE